MHQICICTYQSFNGAKVVPQFTNWKDTIRDIWGGSPGLIVMEMTNVQEVVSSNPDDIYWMEMTFFHIDLL